MTNTNDELALDAVRHDEADDGRAPETRATRMPARGADTGIEAVTAEIGRQTRAIETIARSVSAREARSRVEALQPRARVAGVEPSSQRALQALRGSAAEQDRLARRGRTDPLITERNARINASIDGAKDREIAELKRKNLELAKKANRPNGPSAQRGGTGDGISSRSRDIATYQKASREYLRYGTEIFDGQTLRQLERKAFQTQDTTQGGYLVQPEYDNVLASLMLPYVNMRKLASVQSISTGLLKKPVNLKGTAANWSGEVDARPATSTPSMAELDFPVMELYAEPLISQITLEDSFVDVESMINADVAEAFGVAEAVAFTAGDGNRKPMGLLSYPVVPWVQGFDGRANFGKVAYIPTGVAGAFAGTAPADAIVQMAYNLKPGYRTNATYMMNRAIIGAARVLKNSFGEYLWRDGSLSAGQPDTLNGHAVSENEQMPGMAANALIIAFGDWKRAYLIVDHVGLSVLRDPFSAKPYVMFYTRKRVGGGVQNFESFNLLRASVT